MTFTQYPIPFLVFACFVSMFCTAGSPAAAQGLDAPLAAPDLVFEEVDGVVAGEAEHFFEQTQTDVRRWYRTTATEAAGLEPDIDPPHAEGASGGAYLEILPDTRWTHGEKLVWGENFMNDPGQMAILSYKVHINQPGRYYVWGRIYSTGSEDNGLHVGLNGEWPESGRRLQWCEGKHMWRWESRQRTPEKHCGEKFKIYLDIGEPGEHVIQFAMREDGTEFDKWMMTLEQLESVEGSGPEAHVKRGTLPEAFAVPETLKDAENSQPREPDGDGAVELAGELKQWHKVTLTVDGPFAHELDTTPNPFTGYRFDVTFTHDSGSPRYRVPGYFAADGSAAETSAQAGTQWRAHLSPDKPGTWSYAVHFTTAGDAPSPLMPFDGVKGTFEIAPTDKTGRDFREGGRLTYVGKHHLRQAGSGRYFLKAGPDSPETLLAYEDFDGTRANKPGQKLKSWSPHASDWREGEPAWQGGKGKGLIGAINYLADKGVNAMSFMPYNAGGDGDNVWPFVERNQKLHYDCSKLDQWQIVFDHAQAQGIFLHFKTQETEMDDNRDWNHNIVEVPTSLDNGELGPERKLYYRELIARFGYLLALNWNLGEETTQSAEEHRAMAGYFHDHDPYRHLVVIHTKGSKQEQAKVYDQLTGDQSRLTGTSLQNWWGSAHALTRHWVQASAEAGQPWVVANDEQGGADVGVPPDWGYQGYQGGTNQHGKPFASVHDIRKATLWGNLMAGGTGVEYYFGYKVPQTDLNCEDWRSRDSSWDYCAIALSFFHDHGIPFWDMVNRNGLVGNPQHQNTNYCLTKPGEVYLVYLSRGGDVQLDLSGEPGGSSWSLRWFNPREGGEMQPGAVDALPGGQAVSLGSPREGPEDVDWLAVVARQH